MNKENIIISAQDYLSRLKAAIDLIPLKKVEELSHSLIRAWKERRQVFIFGNGGSAGNAIHLANDFIYGISKQLGGGMKITALPSNVAVITCLANDEGYDQIFVQQLAVLGKRGDLAIALSGSGNSPNIIKSLEFCIKNEIETFAIVGYSGGKSKNIANSTIHTPVDDMQISEDLQLIIGHILMQYLAEQKYKI
jgi:D-sedoheptulose 7-phosphate isomerase